MKFTEQNLVTLTQSQLMSVLKNLPSIEIEFDWDYDDRGNDYGTYKNEDHEIEFDNWFIRCELFVTESGKTTSSTYLQPSEFNSIGYQVEVGKLELWNDEDEIELTEQQYEKIVEQIIKNII
ncbi:hypothetical protein PL373_13410 [Tenacibaculum maritimum]|nr:hypothetical protein [Tenacibaculum maritimum]MDB0602127.1 hypothetical protein [Tenacibaculum maritimum]MDB0613802.1 hypothetical protein [Tenacibaculum maritimum]